LTLTCLREEATAGPFLASLPFAIRLNPQWISETWNEILAGVAASEAKTVVAWFDELPNLLRTLGSMRRLVFRAPIPRAARRRLLPVCCPSGLPHLRVDPPHHCARSGFRRGPPRECMRGADRLPARQHAHRDQGRRI
jgi:hypothetical protein